MFTGLTELLGMSMAYDTGINITSTRKRKGRKGVKDNFHKEVETIVMTSKEVSEITGEVFAELFSVNKYMNGMARG